MLKEFKEFAMRGSLIDMAIGIVIGAAFGVVTKVFIDGLFMPLVGMVFQVKDLSSWAVKVGTTDAGPVMLQVGAFIAAVINFIIVAFVMFMIIKGMNAMKKKQAEAPPAPPAPTKEEALLAEIRDILKNK